MATIRELLEFDYSQGIAEVKKLIEAKSQLNKLTDDVSKSVEKELEDQKKIDEAKKNQIKQIQDQNKSIKDLVLNYQIQGRSINSLIGQYQKEIAILKKVSLARKLALGFVVAFGAALVTAGRASLEYNKSIQPQIRLVEQINGLYGKQADELRVLSDVVANRFNKSQEQVLSLTNSIAVAFKVTQSEALKFYRDQLVKTASANDEFGDSVVEYGREIVGFGGDLQDVAKIINQSFKDGIFSDKLIDTTLEALRSISKPIESTRIAVNGLGKDFADNLFSEIEKGNITALDGFKNLINRIKEVEVTPLVKQGLLEDVFKGAGEGAGGLDGIVSSLSEAFFELSEQQKIINNLTGEFNEKLSETQQGVEDNLTELEKLALEKDEFFKSNAVIAFQKNIENGIISIKTFAFSLLNSFNDIERYIVGLGGSVRGFFDGVFDNIATGVDRISNRFGSIFSAIKDGDIGGVFSAIKEGFTDTGDVAEDNGLRVRNAIQAGKDAALDAYDAQIKGLADQAKAEEKAIENKKKLKIATEKEAAAAKKAAKEKEKAYDDLIKKLKDLSDATLELENKFKLNNSLGELRKLNELLKQTKAELKLNEEEFINSATAAGFTADQLKSAKEQFAEFAKISLDAIETKIRVVIKKDLTEKDYGNGSSFEDLIEGTLNEITKEIDANLEIEAGVIISIDEGNRSELVRNNAEITQDAINDTLAALDDIDVGIALENLIGFDIEEFKKKLLDLFDLNGDGIVTETEKAAKGFEIIGNAVSKVNDILQDTLKNTISDLGNDISDFNSNIESITDRINAESDKQAKGLQSNTEVLKQELQAQIDARDQALQQKEALERRAVRAQKITDDIAFASSVAVFLAKQFATIGPAALITGALAIAGLKRLITEAVSGLLNSLPGFEKGSDRTIGESLRGRMHIQNSGYDDTLVRVNKRESIVKENLVGRQKTASQKLGFEWGNENVTKYLEKQVLNGGAQMAAFEMTKFQFLPLPPVVVNNATTDSKAFNDLVKEVKGLRKELRKPKATPVSEWKSV